ncbi:RidA family protein [Methylonatrum kenyense]|uniref:RidA family protein n=1 Tax=Methylonatrum kenyense TaxID=455253 RepID=UPI0020C0DC04|nr:RidA family protein [Methylonatrum kenyense]MCK8516868.1 RidA family protein [Methylonatrum kenyense]
MQRTTIQTDRAPQAIGPYSQAVRAGDTVWLSGQIPLVPATGEPVEGDAAAHVRQVFENLKGLAEASGGSLQHVVKLTIFLTDMDNFGLVNELMQDYFHEPYPARAAVGVASLPKGVDVEMEAIMVLDGD